MRRATLQHVAVLWLVATGGAQAAWGQGSNFFTSSPGALTKEHAELDAQARCNDCHVNGSKELSNDKCLACHDHNDLKSRIAAGQGYHASGKVRGRKCE